MIREIRILATWGLVCVCLGAVWRRESLARGKMGLGLFTRGPGELKGESEAPATNFIYCRF